MEQFETIQGMLFYTVYMMHKQNQITDNQKGKLKDMIVTRNPSLTKMSKDSTQIEQTLLDLANCSSDLEESTRITNKPTPRARPMIQIGRSNRMLGSHSCSSLNVSPVSLDINTRRRIGLQTHI